MSEQQQSTPIKPMGFGAQLSPWTVSPQEEYQHMSQSASSSFNPDPWKNFPHEQVMVTGSQGFIGRSVVTLLEKLGVTVITFDLSDGHDVREYGALVERGYDCGAIIHLAGVLGTHELFDNPQRAVDVNITGSLNVMQMCLLHKAQYTGITMPQVFPSIYTATKIATTRLATALHHSGGLRCAHVRAFNAYGPGQAHGRGHPQKIIPTFSVKAWRGEPIPIWGDGSQGVDLIHADELAKLLVYSTQFVDDRTIDGGSGRMFTVLEVARKVCEIVGVDPLIQFLPMRRGEIPTQIRAEGEGWDHLPWNPYHRPDLTETVLSYATWSEREH